MTAFSDFTDVLSAFTTGTYTVTRYSPANYGSDGRAVVSTASTFTVKASVFPVGGKDLQRLPEGLRTQQLRSVITSVELKTQGAAQEPDSIAIEGDAWQVQSVEPWANGGNFWASIVSKRGN